MPLLPALLPIRIAPAILISPAAARVGLRVDDAVAIRRMYVGRPLWTIGPVQIGRADAGKAFTEIASGTRLVLARADRLPLAANLSASGMGSESPDVMARRPVRLTFKARYFRDWQRTTVYRMEVADLAHLQHILSAIPPPKSVMKNGEVLSLPVEGMTPDQAAWIWGWPPVRRTKPQMRRMSTWDWGTGRPRLFFVRGRVKEFIDFPDLP